MKQKKRVLNYFAAELPGIRKRFDPESGRFLAENGGWAVTMQDVILPLARLWCDAGTDCQGRDDVFELVCRGGDALRDAQDEVGRVEYVKTDGSRWGWIYMPWSMLHWLETFALLRDQLDPDRRARWEKGLVLAYGGVTGRLSLENLHNIPAWHAAGLSLASRLFDTPEWRETGSEYMRAVADSQDLDGYWAEGFGPTTLYNLVYVHALGLYYHWTHDEYVLPCLERAADFHMHFTYPDGSACATVDGRGKYHAWPMIKGGPGFLAVPAGRRFFKNLVDRYIAYCRDEVEVGQRGKNSSDLQELADAYPWLDADAAEPAPPGLMESRECVSLRCERALVRRHGDWFVCLSAYLTPREKRSSLSRSRWNMDRQSYIGIWHEGSGLVVGGGNSKHQPELATFEVRTGALSLCQADSASLRQEGGCDILRLVYGDTTTEVRLRTRGNGLELVFALVEMGSDAREVLGGFMIPRVVDQSMRTSTAPDGVRLAPLQMWGEAWAEKGGWVAWKGVRLDLTNAYMRWPVYPFNPYAVNDASPPGAAVAIVGFTLEPDRRERRFVFQSLTC